MNLLLVWDGMTIPLLAIKCQPTQPSKSCSRKHLNILSFLHRFRQNNAFRFHFEVDANKTVVCQRNNSKAKKSWPKCENSWNLKITTTNNNNRKIWWLIIIDDNKRMYWIFTVFFHCQHGFHDQAKIYLSIIDTNTHYFPCYISWLLYALTVRNIFYFFLCRFHCISTSLSFRWHEKKNQRHFSATRSVGD
jgi:hypothetical protein